MTADITRLSDFLSTYDVVSPMVAAERLCIDEEMFDRDMFVYIYDGECYITQTMKAQYHVMIGRHDTLHETQDEAATRLYLEHYVSECVEPTAWSTNSLTNLLHDYCLNYNLGLASADEIMFDLMSIDPKDRDIWTNTHIAWLEWFIDLWNDTQMDEDVAATMDY